MAAAQAFPRSDQSASGNHHFIFNHRAVHNSRGHTYQYPIAYSAAVQNRAVADGYVATDVQGPAIGVEGSSMRDMQYAAILHAGPGADSDTVHIAADGNLRPYRYIILQSDLAQHYGAGVDQHALANIGAFALETTEADVVVVSHGCELVAA